MLVEKITTNFTVQLEINTIYFVSYLALFCICRYWLSTHHEEGDDTNGHSAVSMKYLFVYRYMPACVSYWLRVIDWVFYLSSDSVATVLCLTPWTPLTQHNRPLVKAIPVHQTSPSSIENFKMSKWNEEWNSESFNDLDKLCTLLSPKLCFRVGSMQTTHGIYSWTTT